MRSLLRRRYSCHLRRCCCRRHQRCRCRFRRRCRRPSSCFPRNRFRHHHYCCRQTSSTNPTTTIFLRASMKLLPRCFLHPRSRCLCGRLPGRTTDLPRICQCGSCLLLRLEWHRHLLLRPQLPRPCCSRAVCGVGWFSPQCLSCASCYPKLHRLRRGGVVCRLITQMPCNRLHCQQGLSNYTCN